MSTPITDPVQAEALGEDYVTAVWKGREWRIPADADSWPLDHVRYSVGYTRERGSVVNHIAIAQALRCERTRTRATRAHGGHPRTLTRALE